MFCISIILFIKKKKSLNIFNLLKIFLLNINKGFVYIVFSRMSTIEGLLCHYLYGSVVQDLVDVIEKYDSWKSEILNIYIYK